MKFKPKIKFIKFELYNYDFEHRPNRPSLLRTTQLPYNVLFLEPLSHP